MRALTVNGGAPLFGEVSVGGSKNAALPILFAALAARGTSVINNIPDIGDVRCAIKIIEWLGAAVERRGSRLTVSTDGISYRKPPCEFVSSIRASTYLIGSCLAAFGICHIQPFGGCNFSARPIDFHLRLAEEMGAAVEDDIIRADALTPALIRLPKPSVGATVNALIMTSATEGTSMIYGSAREPHILSLIDFLRSAGASITCADECITVKGGGLHGGEITLIGDMIEAGTYLTSALATGGDVTVKGIDPAELIPFTAALTEAGARFDIGGRSVRAYGEICRPISVLCTPYPGFPTDLQPIIAPLCGLHHGGRIRDTVFPDRFGYLNALSLFGIGHNTLLDTAYIYGSQRITPATVSAPDLRGGAACIIAALAAEGKSRIDGITAVERGYEGISGKLRSLGADVRLTGCHSAI